MPSSSDTPTGNEMPPSFAQLDDLKQDILRLTRQYARHAHRAFRPGWDSERTAFDPERGAIPYAGRVFTEDEVEAAVGSTLDFWLTLGAEGEAFQKELAAFLGVKACLAVNSGSSANLLALSALTSPLLPAERRLQPGDEVITCAAGFPTTVTPILQNGCIPVFIDNDPCTGNLLVSQLGQAYTPGRTKAVMAAHALGNPFDLGAVLAFCQEHQLWLVEDNCDALGCSYAMPRAQAEALGFSENSPGLDAGPNRVIRWTGTWGDLSTQSFYPPHHLTMGEGGAVNITRSGLLRRIVESFRDWGRDCWCPSGKDNTCGKRYDWQLGELPQGYDHKYIYSHLGYNLKPLDPQAAIGRVQIRRLPEFIEARKRNWLRLRRGLDPLSHLFRFCLPTHATGFDAASGSFQWDSSGASTDCSWFGFLLLVRPEAPFSSSDLGRHLADAGVGTRMLFGGNLLRQPVFVQLRHDRPEALRLAVSELPGADQLMNQALFLGTYPGLSDAMIDREIAYIKAFVSGFVPEVR
ncbi:MULTISPECIES: lipopolysaccharide biosynthesis protein RfbH [unclassified Synechococcus]|uniref:lipopolysaccharide biosynthesis protein RfbH n=1 Tax=Synechococcales TaxID=1890424 RepID=UPI00210756D4|nr:MULTISPECIES: lipopolysaccharide biosynthesis protein RfbH [unclassified Synechococcus]